MKSNPTWPVLKRYEGDQLRRLAMPLGGIGTGTVSLGGRGHLQDWEIMNRPAKSYAPASLFAVWARPSGGKATARAAEGLIDRAFHEGCGGCAVPFHGLPRFGHCTFAAAYPLGQVLLSDPDMPVNVRLEAFNPMVPADAEASGIPVAVLRYVLINKTHKPVRASVCGTVTNIIGNDGHKGQSKGNHNTFKRAGVQGLFMQSREVERTSQQYGTMALTTTAKTGITYRQHWLSAGWWGDVIDFWDDFAADGRLETPHGAGVMPPQASLAVSTSIAPRGQKAVTFLLSWHFPNRGPWQMGQPPLDDEAYIEDPKHGIGNHYAKQYKDAWDVAVKTARSLSTLEKQTVKFVDTFVQSDLPEAVKDAALSNASTLRTQTCFRAGDGRLYGFEGCGEWSGCCPGSCTHVWNYEHTTAFLYGDLARTMRDVEFGHTTNDLGRMDFRAGLPILDNARVYGLSAADGQMGCVMKLYRDWQLCGDDAMLKQLWPIAKRALEFCWVEGGWDADRDGVMEGCQHNTMDVEYYGPNPHCTVMYLGALRAGEQMAGHLGDDPFASICRELFERGSRWVDEHLFNGEFFIQLVRTPGKGKTIAKGLGGSADIKDPPFQIGPGCEVNALLGQLFAHIVGLGDLVKRSHARKQLRSFMKYNFKQGFTGHFNHARSYAMNDESGLVMCTWPRGGRPRFPYPYAMEVWTGLEYTVAAHLAYEGMTAAAQDIVHAVRQRHDGRARNPFNEAECGHHYARAMAAWAVVIAMTGFRYQGGTQSITFAATDKPSKHFWSNGYAWGQVQQTPSRGQTQVKLTVHHGKITVKNLTITKVGSVELPRAKSIGAGQSALFRIKQ